MYMAIFIGESDPSCEISPIEIVLPEYNDYTIQYPFNGEFPVIWHAIFMHHPHLPLC